MINPITNWLSHNADPAIRWQTLRDLTDTPADAITAERARVPHEGWGARLLSLQTADGHWNDEQEHGWMTTMDALALLRRFGVDPDDARVRGALDLVQARITWHQIGGEPFFDGETEACINGQILASGAYFGAPVERLLARLLSEQLADGGWNCEAPGSTRSSFHSTICVLEGLLEYERRHGPTTDVTDAARRGLDYLLERRMLRSMTTGEVINARWMQFTFPPLWQYDVLRGLDYLRDAGVTPDERVAEAIALVEQKRTADGRWPLDALPEDWDRLKFDVEPDVGQPSRWNTLRALRVLKWAGR